MINRRSAVRTKKGALIAIEGIDAVGKRTQSALLVRWLRAKGKTTASLSFPDYGTEIGREIRRFFNGERNYPAEAIHMLLAANRWEKKWVLGETIAKNDAVVVNRYSGSNLAYGTSNGLDLDWLLNLEAGLPAADVVCVLDAAPQTLLTRRELSRDRYERNLTLQDKARKAYLTLAPRFGWVIVDASKGIEATSTSLTEAVAESLALKGRTV